MGCLSPATELPEGTAVAPEDMCEINTATSRSATACRLRRCKRDGDSSAYKWGLLIPPTFLKRSEADAVRLQRE